MPLFLQNVSVDVPILKLLLSQVPNNNPPKLVTRVLVLDHIYYFVLGSLIDEVDLGHNRQSSFAFWIDFAGYLDNFLRRNVHVCWNNGQHDRTWVLHVIINHVSDKHYIILCGDSMDSVFEYPWDINHTEMILPRTTNFKPENAVGERRLSKGSNDV